METVNSHNTEASADLSSNTEPTNTVYKIKKYGNRRFYCSQNKKYINLSDIEQLIHQQNKVVITDADTNSDITSEILTQILLDKGRATLFPAELLEEMIRTNEKNLKNIWTPLLQQQMKIMLQMTDLTVSNFKTLLSQFTKK